MCTTTSSASVSLHWPCVYLWLQDLTCLRVWQGNPLLRRVGISGGCVSMHNVPNLQNIDTLLILIIFWGCMLNIYPLSFCSLQYIYKDMNHSYPCVCLQNSQRQLKILYLPYHNYKDN